MKLFKYLFSRRSRGEEALTKKVGRVTPCAPSSPPPVSEDETLLSHTKKTGPIAIPSPLQSDGRGEGQGEVRAPNSKLNTQNSTFPLDPDNKRNGKIAKLPRHLRDHINRAFDSGQSAVSIAQELNKLPEVKAILDTHFEGRPIRHQNLSEWKAGGYRDWQLRQELLYQQQELAADAQEMAKIAHGMDDSLFGMALLDYARLMRNTDNDTPEEFEKKRKALSNMINDIVRLRRCQNQTRGVEVQEERLERDREKTSEEIFLKFMEWASNPEIRRTFILEPMVAMALQRRHFGLPPRPEDLTVLKEYGYSESPKTEENREVPADFPPLPTKNPEASATPTEPEPSPEPEQVGRVTPCAPSSPPPTSESVPPQPDHENTGSNAFPSSGGEGKGEGELSQPRNEALIKKDSISPISPISPSASEDHSSTENAGPAVTNSKLNTQNSKLSNPPQPQPDNGLSQVYAALTPSLKFLEERRRQQEENSRKAEAIRQARFRLITRPYKPSPLDFFSEPC